VGWLSSNPHLHADGMLWENQAVMILFTVSAVCCFMGSVLFHLFNPLSRKLHWRLRMLDFSGISFCIIGSQWPLMHLSFYCHPAHRSAYPMILCMMALVGIVLSLFPIFHMPKFRIIRITVFIGMALFPLVMLLHSMYVHGLYDPVYSLFLSLFQSYLIYLVGLIFYVTRYPESRHPGKFDIWWTSHQWWHVCIIIGEYVWFTGFSSYMRWRISTPCVP